MPIIRAYCLFFINLCPLFFLFFFQVRHEFDENAINPKSALLNLVIESTANDCSDSVAYISDVQGFGLTIFNMKDRTSYRVDHPRFYPDPDYGIITSNGITFNLMDGIFGLALSLYHQN